MHDTALICCLSFIKMYAKKGMTVVEIGGKNVNGSIRNNITDLGMNYICVDIEKDKSVDIVIKPSEQLPFKPESVDIIISTSCFEHDPCFWLTFKEMCRIIKKEGFIYVNAPSNGKYHCFPCDNWRFNPDAGQALAYWSGIQMGNEKIYPVEICETFLIPPINDIWTDFVCVWKRVDEKNKQTTIVRDTKLIKNSGILENELSAQKIKITKYDIQ